MNRVIRKVFIDYEKEEKWLNTMSAKGLALVDYHFNRYVFAPAQPGEYIYRIELLEEMPLLPKTQSYLQFLQETGVELIATQVRWAYFRKKAVDGPFDIFSDRKSKCKHYARIALMLGIVGASNLLIAGLNIRLGITTPSMFNIYISGLNLFVGGVLLKLTVSYLYRRYQLKKDSRLME